MNLTTHPILLFDGDCGVCGHAVRFVLRHDRAGRFRFASLTSAVGRRLLAEHGVRPEVDSVVLIDSGTARLRSGAVLGILRRLGGGWHLLRVLGVIPRPLRDAAYDAVARRRTAISRHLGWSCLVPTEQEWGRFLDREGVRDGPGGPSVSASDRVKPYILGNHDDSDRPIESD